MFKLPLPAYKRQILFRAVLNFWLRRIGISPDCTHLPIAIGPKFALPEITFACFRLSMKI